VEGHKEQSIHYVIIPSLIKETELFFTLELLIINNQLLSSKVKMNIQKNLTNHFIIIKSIFFVIEYPPARQQHLMELLFYILESFFLNF
jgi:hypothetical protein